MIEKQYPLVSVVFLNFNGQKYADQWSSLFMQDYPDYEIIFVDNGSRDGSETTFEKVAYDHPHIKVRMLKLDMNCGYSKANNLGADKARGKYVVLLSNDIKVTKDWLKNAITELESNDRIGVAQSVMFKLDDPSKFDPMGNYIDAFGLNHPFLFTKEPVKDVFYCEGAVMFIRRKALKESLGLFDDSYFMFYEDVDFCWRIHLMGYRTVVLQKSAVYHKRGGTVSGTLMKVDPKYVFTNTRNRLNTLLKNYSTGNMVRFIPISIAIEMLKGFSLILNKKSSAGLACFKGILSFLSGIHHTMKKRTLVQNKRKVKDDEILKLMVPLSDALRDVIRNAIGLRREWKKG
jgi:GT2 family glycosyltransferase